MRGLTSFAVVCALFIGSAARADVPALGLSLAREGVLSPGATMGVSLPTLLLGATEAAPVEARKTIFGLPQNIGPIERILRGALAATLIGIGTYRLATGSGAPGWSYAFLALAALPGLTAATGYCPAYHLFGIDFTF